MNLKNALKIIGIILVFVILQSYFINPDNLSNVIGKWVDYFMTIIISIFIAILLEPIVRFIKRKTKANEVLAISLSITLVVLIFVFLTLIIIPEIISSIKELNDMYPYLSEKAMSIGKKGIDYLAKKDIYTIDINKIESYFNNFIENNITGIKDIWFDWLDNKFYKFIFSFCTSIFNFIR